MTPDHMVCFSLYTASRATTQLYRRLLEPWGLTYPQYLVLVLLWAKGSQSVGQLGDDLDLDSGTLSPLLRRMEANDLVSRTRDTGDERVVMVALTDRGEQLRTETSAVPEAIGTAMGLTEESARTLLDAVHTYTASVQSAAAAS